MRESSDLSLLEGSSQEPSQEVGNLELQSSLRFEDESGDFRYNGRIYPLGRSSQSR